MVITKIEIEGSPFSLQRHEGPLYNISLLCREKKDLERGKGGVVIA
jgi:hypothetical protein